MIDEPTQAEKRAVLRNDALVRGAALADVAEVFNPQPGGRFAASAPTTTSIPRQPEGSPWAADPVPPEPPLGFSVDDLPIVGEPHEIERSIAAPALTTPVISAPGVVEPSAGAAPSRIRRL
jgi:hypothetical protein